MYKIDSKQPWHFLMWKLYTEFVSVYNIVLCIKMKVVTIHSLTNQLFPILWLWTLPLKILKVWTTENFASVYLFLSCRLIWPISIQLTLSFRDILWKERKERQLNIAALTTRTDYTNTFIKQDSFMFLILLSIYLEF